MAARDMVARHSNYDKTRDFIPTPPYATRALFEYVVPEWRELIGEDPPVYWDPAAGRGHMVNVLKEYGVGIGSDIQGHGIIKDFLDKDQTPMYSDYIITNPPYKHAEAFVHRALECASYGVAMLLRIQFLESQGRWERLFKSRPPTQVAIFADRIPFKVGEVVRKAPKMFTHMWCCWDKVNPDPRPVMWVPPTAQKDLERDSDYE